MEVLGYFLGALKELCSLTGFIYVVIGTLAGVVLGAIPGLGSKGKALADEVYHRIDTILKEYVQR